MDDAAPGAQGTSGGRRPSEGVRSFGGLRAGLAVAAVVLLVVGVLAVLDRGGGPTGVRAVADRPPPEVPTGEPVTSPPPTEAGGAREPTSVVGPTTTTTGPAPTPTTVRAGTVSEVVEPPAAEGCSGLRSETVWAVSGDADEITAPAGGSADYVETVTNDGPTTCSMVFARCPGPGVLRTVQGAPAPRTSQGCPAIGHAPEDLHPGGSLQQSFTAELDAAPGAYDLDVRQHDGRVATLPIRLDDRLAACDRGTLRLDQPYEAYTERGGVAWTQLPFESGALTCTIRITETRLTLRPSGTDGGGHVLVDDARRWYATGGPRTVGEAHFGAVDLPAGEYEGSLTVHLDSGEALTVPARLLVG